MAKMTNNEAKAICTPAAIATLAAYAHPHPGMAKDGKTMQDWANYWVVREDYVRVAEAIAKRNTNASSIPAATPTSSLPAAKGKRGSKTRSYILGYSATSVIKWMGQHDWSLAKAMTVVEKLITPAGKMATSSVLTAMTDGKNPKYQTGIPALGTAEIEKLEKAAAEGGHGTAENSSEAYKALQTRMIALEQRLVDIHNAQPVEIVIKRADAPAVTIDEKLHPIFEQVMFHLGCGDNVMLVGPSGCGKTHLAEQIAKIMDLDHAALSLSGGVTESKIFGRVTPNITTGKSEFHGTPFTEMYENGGVVLLDEVDAADPNVLLSLNLALGNRRLTLDRPKNPLVRQHKDFVCLAAANTWGNGADRQYVGRNQQDGAFNARFVQLSMDYDENLERSLCANAELCERLQQYRANCRRNRLERIVSTRFLCRAANWVANGKDFDYVDSMLFAGWREDEVKKAKSSY